MLQLEGVPLPELRCKCLTLEMDVTKYNLYGVTSLLRTSPLLETLNIHLGVGVGISLNLCSSFYIHFYFLALQTPKKKKERMKVFLRRMQISIVAFYLVNGLKKGKGLVTN